MKNGDLRGKSALGLGITLTLFNAYVMVLIVFLFSVTRTAAQQKPSGTDEKRLIQDCAMRYRSGEMYDALAVCRTALEHFKAVGDRRGEAITLSNIGSVHSALGNKLEAEGDFNRALILQRALDDRRGEATTLNNIGVLFSARGEKQKLLAREYYNQALKLERAVGDRQGEATTLNNIGSVHSALGQKQKGLEYYNQALVLYRAVHDRRGEATTLNNIGDVNFALGEREKALEYLQQALPLQTAVGDRSGAATSLSNMGSVYSALGDKSAALQCYNQVLALQKAIGDRRGEAMALNMIGNLHSTLGERQEALEYFRRALPIERAVGDRQLEAITLKNINHTSLSSLLANVLTNNIRLLVWILGLVFSLATWIGTRWTRRGSRTWPTTEARIECRSIARDDKGRTWACRLGYSYTVDGQYYSGFAEKTFRSEELASAYRNRVKDGHRVLSRYNPRNPNTSVLDLRILEIGQVPEPRVNTNDGRSRDSRQPIEVLASAAASNPDVSNDIVAISEMSTLSSLEIDSWPNPPDGTEKTRNSLSVVALPKNERR